MRGPRRTNQERHLLSAIALLCYATTLVALLVIGYYLAALAFGDLGRSIVALNPHPALP